MFSFLRGNIVFTEEGCVALDVNGVGYKVAVTERTLENANKTTDMLLYTSLIVNGTDMSFSLYGFETRHEKNMFERLISVSGVGPKAGLAILSRMSLSEIAQALLAGDVKAFSKVNGIGPKTAGRIVLELKDKVDVEDVAADASGTPIGGVTPETEAVEALMGIGYSKAEAVSAVSAVSALADTAEDLTLMALKRLAM